MAGLTTTTTPSLTYVTIATSLHVDDIWFQEVWLRKNAKKTHGIGDEDLIEEVQWRIVDASHPLGKVTYTTSVQRASNRKNDLKSDV